MAIIKNEKEIIDILLLDNEISSIYNNEKPILEKKILIHISSLNHL